VALLWPLALLGAAGDVGQTVSSQEAEQRRQKIEGLSQADRQRLQQKYQQFLALSESQKFEYRELHQALEANPKLRDVVLRYTEWLETLLPWQQREIRREKEPSAKLKLVLDYMQEQRRREAATERFYPGVLGPEMRFRGFGPRMSSADLNAVLAAVERDVGPTLTRDRREALQKHEGLSRHLVLLEAVLQREQAIGRTTRDLWPDERLMSQMIATLSVERLRRHLESISEPEAQRRSLVQTLVRGLGAELQQQAAQKVLPAEGSQEKLDELFTKLDDRRREEIMRMPTDMANRRLALLYLWQHPEEFPVDGEQFRSVVQQLFARAGFRPPRGPGEGRPFDNPRGDRRPETSPPGT
jgi:hypothetical protein